MHNGGLEYMSQPRNYNHTTSVLQDRFFSIVNIPISNKSGFIFSHNYNDLTPCVLKYHYKPLHFFLLTPAFTNSPRFSILPPTLKPLQQDLLTSLYGVLYQPQDQWGLQECPDQHVGRQTDRQTWRQRTVRNAHRWSESQAALVESSTTGQSARLAFIYSLETLVFPLTSPALCCAIGHPWPNGLPFLPFFHSSSHSTSFPHALPSLKKTASFIQMFIVIYPYRWRLWWSHIF